MYLLILSFVLVGLTAKIKNNKYKSKFYFELPSTTHTSIQESATNAITGSLSKERAVKITST